jgi:hypothetical protein
VWCAREIVGDEPFAVRLPDMLSPGAVAQMLAPMRSTAATSSPSRGSRRDQTHPYGIRRGRENLRRHLRDHRHGREAAEGHGAVEPHHLGALHPAARDLRRPLRPGKGRRRRNPAHRRHERLSQAQKFLRHDLQGARLTTPARSSASSWPTSPTRSSATTSPSPSAASSRPCSRDDAQGW